MLSSVYLKTLRECRVAILGFGAGLGILLVIALTQVQAFLATAESRAALLEVAQSFRWFSEPVEVLTPGGFVTFRLGPFLFILPAIWALLAGSGTLRGEEDRGALDVLLSVPRSRTRIAVEKFAALLTALLLIGLLLGLFALAGGAAASAAYGPVEALLLAANVALSSGFFAALALFVSQLTPERRPAAGLTGVALVLSFLLDATARANPAWQGLRLLSPMYYYNLSKPLVPGHGAHAGAMLLLAGATVLLGGTAVLLFAGRDVGASALSRRGRSWAMPGQAGVPPRRGTGQAGEPPLVRGPALAGEWHVRGVLRRSLRVAAGTSLWWGAAMAIYAAWSASLARGVQRSLAALLQGPSVPAAVAATLAAGRLETVPGVLSLMVFSFAPVLLAVLAVTLAVGWAAEEAEGRLELLLATPQPRPAILAARFGASAAATVAVATAVLAGVAAGARMTDLAIDTAHLAAAAYGMVPPALAVLAAGFALAGWLRPAAMAGTLIALVTASLFVTSLGPVLRWPDWLVRLSIFTQYGAPMVTGVDWPAVARLLAAAAVLLAVATARFAGKDVGR